MPSAVETARATVRPRCCVADGDTVDSLLRAGRRLRRDCTGAGARRRPPGSRATDLPAISDGDRNHGLVRAGPGPAPWPIVLSSLGFNYFLTEPRYSLYIAPSDRAYFVVFVLFAVLIGWFASRRRRIEHDASPGARRARGGSRRANAAGGGDPQAQHRPPAAADRARSDQQGTGGIRLLHIARPAGAAAACGGVFGAPAEARCRGRWTRRAGATCRWSWSRRREWAT